MPDQIMGANQQLWVIESGTGAGLITGSLTATLSSAFVTVSPSGTFYATVSGAGTFNVNEVSTTGSFANFWIGSPATAISASNSSRSAFTLQNAGRNGNTIYFGSGANLTDTTTNWDITPDSWYNLEKDTQAWYAYVPGGGSELLQVFVA